MTTRNIDYQRWKNLTGEDQRMYRMVSGIYGALGDMDFRVNQYNRATLDAIESLYYNITVRDICIMSVNQLSSYLKDDPDIEGIVETIDAAISMAKKAILVLKNNTYVEELLKLHTFLNNTKDVVISRGNLEFKADGWVLLRDSYLRYTKDVKLT